MENVKIHQMTCNITNMMNAIVWCIYKQLRDFTYVPSDMERSSNCEWARSWRGGT